jgi:hypothetical protein
MAFLTQSIIRFQSCLTILFLMSLIFPLLISASVKVRFGQYVCIHSSLVTNYEFTCENLRNNRDGVPFVVADTDNRGAILRHNSKEWLSIKNLQYIKEFSYQTKGCNISMCTAKDDENSANNQVRVEYNAPLAPDTGFRRPQWM